jgi:hypothetical protein
MTGETDDDVRPWRNRDSPEPPDVPSHPPDTAVAARWLGKNHHGPAELLFLEAGPGLGKQLLSRIDRRGEQTERSD